MVESLPKRQHKSPEVRKQAVCELDDHAVLLDLVKADPELSVQSAALARIHVPAILDELIDSPPTPWQSQARAQRLQQLMPGHGSLDSEAARFGGAPFLLCATTQPDTPFGRVLNRLGMGRQLITCTELPGPSPLGS